LKKSCGEKLFVSGKREGVFSIRLRENIFCEGEFYFHRGISAKHWLMPTDPSQGEGFLKASKTHVTHCTSITIH